MSKTILVTGGGGFIGSHLVERLQEEGYQVVVVDVKEGIDIRDYEKMQQIFSKYKPKKVVHLASEVGVRPSIERPEDYISTNILGTQTVLELVRDFKVKQFLFASSSSVYGKRSGRTGFRETDPVSPISPYGLTKVAAEELCRTYANMYGIPTTCLRFFTVYGPNNRRDMACFTFTDAVYHGRPIYLFGKYTKRDFTYVADIVDGIIKTLQHPLAFEVINLGNSQPALILQLVRLIEKNLGKKAKVRWQPLPSTDVPITFADVDKARKLLRWEPKISLDEGVRKLVEWYNSAYV